MSLILSLSLVIGFIICYLLLIQIFTVLFRLTGLTKEKARFQVISLLTNSGFTTRESELITNNKTRRKIAKIVMIVGTIFNVVIASLVINALVSIHLENDVETIKIMGIVIASFVLFLILLNIPPIKKGIEFLIEKIITRLRKKKLTQNIITVIDSYGKKSIVEVYIVHLPSQLEGKSIEDALLRSRYNINLLTIQRNDKNINVKKDTMLQKGDHVVMFGRIANIKELFDIDVVLEHEKEEEKNVNSMSVLDNYASNALVEIEVKNVPSILKNTPLSQSKIKEKHEITILMINHEGKNVLVDANSIVEVGDKIVVIGPYEHIETLFMDVMEN